MYKGKRILALIPARGGSKGIPRKNLRMLAGKPLIAWSIEQALASKYIDRLLVSTEDEEIAQVSKEWGAEVPFMRPMEHATDTSPVAGAILHAMHSLQSAGDTYDVVMLIECTSPVRYPGDLDNVIATLVDALDAESVVGMVPLTHEHPAWAFRISEGWLKNFHDRALSLENCQRQALEPAYLPFSIYATWYHCFERYKIFYQERTAPYVLKREQMMEIDDEIDFFITEKIVENYVLPAWRSASE